MGIIGADTDKRGNNEHNQRDREQDNTCPKDMTRNMVHDQHSDDTSH